MPCRHFRGPPSALPACQGEPTPVAWFCGGSPGRWKTWQRAWLWNPEGHGLRPVRGGPARLHASSSAWEPRRRMFPPVALLLRTEHSDMSRVSGTQ